MVSYGMDYTSGAWSYAETDAVMREDFQTFVDNNIHRITILLHWDQIQPNSWTSFNTAFLNRIVHLCNLANSYGISVDIDFHSGAGNNTSYHVPSWFSGTFDDVATSYRAQWANMEATVIRDYLEACPNIPSYHLFNEVWVPDSTMRQNYIALFTTTHDAIEPLTSRPLSIRFGPYTFFSHMWYSYPEVWNLCDFMCLNIYIGSNNAGHTVENLDQWVALCNQNAKPMYISEFGANIQDDELQRQSVATQVSLLMARNIPVAMLEQYGEFYSSYYYNTRVQSTHIPRPAFYEVAKVNPSGNVSLPYHNNFANLDNLQIVNGTWSVS